MKLPITLIALTTSTSILAQTCDTNREFIIKNLYSDHEYKQFICGDYKCSPESFSNKIHITEENLGRDLRGCFATPIRKAKNYFTGFYLLEEERIRPQFIFFGSWLAPTKSCRNDHYEVSGEELIEAGESELHKFYWNGKNYIEDTEKPNK